MKTFRRTKTIGEGRMISLFSWKTSDLQIPKVARNDEAKAGCVVIELMH